MQPTFWVARARPILPVAWGDYGDMLQHGMSMHSPRFEGRLALERTGPYITPITMPASAIIITREVRASLEASGLTGFTVANVEKARIVEMHWEFWDLEADTPEEYPDSGEPEDYILGKPHSPQTAEALGELFELATTATFTIIRPERVRSFRDLSIDSSTWDGSDLIKSKDYGAMLFSEAACVWFSENWGEYLEFKQFPSH